MGVTAGLLTALAGTLLWPAPRFLARARWTRREPRAALALWQAVGLAAGLALIGAAAAVGLAPLGGGLLGALRRWLRAAAAGTPAGGLDPIHTASLVLAVALTGWLAGVLAVRTAATLRVRRRHRHLVDLVGEPLAIGPDDPARRGHPHGRVLDHPHAVAYCLPGPAPRVVLSSGALAMLDPDELSAVLAHEHAHLAERHDLVVLPFAAWTAALPRLSGVRRARADVGTRVEMLADDRACTRCDRAALATALARVGGGTAPVGALAAGAGPTLERVRRLLDPPRPAPAIRAAAYAAAAGLVVLPTLALVVSSL